VYDSDATTLRPGGHTQTHTSQQLYEDGQTLLHLDEELDEIVGDEYTTRMLRRQAQEASMTDYALEYLNINRRGLLRTHRTPVLKLMSWKIDTIGMPLHSWDEMPEELEDEPVKLFEHLQHFMGDRFSVRDLQTRSPLKRFRNPRRHAGKHSQPAEFDEDARELRSVMGFGRGSSEQGPTPTEDHEAGGGDDDGDHHTPASPSIRHAQRMMRIIKTYPQQMFKDELLCQIVKQVSNNPALRSCVRGWQALLLCLSSFTPSEELHLPLASFISQHVDDENPTVAHLADHALHRLRRSRAVEESTEVASHVEMNAILLLKVTRIRVWIVEDVFIVSRAHSHTTVAEMERQVAARLGVRDTTPFRLFETRGLNYERVLGAHERLMDVLSSWEDQPKDEDWRLVYKVRLYVEVQEEDAAAVELMYRQGVRDVEQDTYPLTDEDVIALGALRVQEQYGALDETDHLMASARQAVPSFLPRHVQARDNVFEITERIIQTYKRLADYDRVEVMMTFVHMLEANPYYGCAYWFVTLDLPNMPSEAILAVSSVGIRLIDEDTRHVLMHLLYRDMIAWGFSPTSFMLTVLDRKARKGSTTYYFGTQDGKDIKGLAAAHKDVTRGTAGLEDYRDGTFVDWDEVAHMVLDQGVQDEGELQVHMRREETMDEGVVVDPRTGTLSHTRASRSGHRPVQSAHRSSLLEGHRTSSRRSITSRPHNDMPRPTSARLTTLDSSGAEGGGVLRRLRPSSAAGPRRGSAEPGGSKVLFRGRAALEGSSVGEGSVTEADEDDAGPWGGVTRSQGPRHEF